MEFDMVQRPTITMQPAWTVRNAGVFLLILALVCDLYLIHVNVVAGVGPRNFFVAAALMASVAIAFKADARPNPFLRRVIALSICFVGLLIAVNALNNVPLFVTLRVISLLGVGTAVVWAGRHLLPRPEHRTLLVRVLLAGLTISAFIAILQFSGVELAWKFREALGLGSDLVVRSQIVNRERASGLAYYSITLAAQLVWAVPLAFAFFIRSGSTLSRVALGLAFAVLLMGAAATLTRSALFGGLIGCGIVWWGARGEWSLGRLLKVIVFLLVAIGLLALVLDNTRLFSLEETSPRAGMAHVAIAIAADHPLGVGTARLSEVLLLNLDKYAMNAAAEELTATSAHNYFLNMLVYYGVAGLVLAAAQVIVAFFALTRLSRRGGTDAVIALGGMGGLFAYVVHAMFHNGGPFLGDMIVWYLMAVIAAANPKVPE